MRILAVIAATFAVSTAQAALIGRAPVTPDGQDFQAYYDDILGITWLADAGLAGSMTFGLPMSVDVSTPGGSIGSLGQMNWETASLWIEAMNEAQYLGATNWRLPRAVIDDFGEMGPACQYSIFGCGYYEHLDSEMAHLFHFTLGNEPVPSNQSMNTNGPFSMPATGNPYFWYGDAVGANTYDASYKWTYHFYAGLQRTHYKDGSLYAWAVHDGDVLAAPTVPIPAAVWLFAGGLAVLGACRRRA